MFEFIGSAAAEGEATATAIAAGSEATLTSIAAEEAPSWIRDAFEKFGETPFTVWVAVGVIAVLGIILLAIGKSAKKWSASMLAYGALAVALSFVLSCIRLFRMPQGGSVTPASMLPIMLFAASFGMGPGLLAGLVYGVLQYFQGGWFLNVWQFALDYLLAFSALGLAGLAKHLPEKWGLYPAMILAALCRALSATLAGIMFWDTAPWASLVYNGTYLIPDTAICMVLAFIVAPRVMREMKRARPPRQ